MTSTRPKYSRILAIAPTARGLGFAVVDGQSTLVDWGATAVNGNKNAKCLVKLARLCDSYEPDIVVLPDATAIGSRRASRIKELCGQMVALAKERKIAVVLITTEKVKGCFFADGLGTKHGIAEILAAQFADDLGPELPPKRKLWDSEDRRMDIFDAVALALVYRLRGSK